MHTLGTLVLQNSPGADMLQFKTNSIVEALQNKGRTPDFLTFASSEFRGRAAV